MPLDDFAFMDLYLRLDAPAAPRYRPLARQEGFGNHLVPPEHIPACHILTQELKTNFTGCEGMFVHAGIRFRVAVNTHANGETWAVLRRIAARVRTLQELGISPNVVHHMMPLGKRDGLVLVSGATGAGKTTTMYGLLFEFLKRHGGTAITIEDPVEYMLEGPVGDCGYGYQIQVHDDDEWATEIKASLRWTPRYILVGEVRTPRAAEQVLRAATTGHLVFTSVHAGSIEESLYGLLHMAEQAMGSGAHHILAAGITACLHQQLTGTGPYIRYIFSEENNNGDPLRALIRENRIGMINTFIDKQAARMAQTQQGNRI